jgi:hypothetical protein
VVASCAMKKYKNGIPTRRVIKTRSVVIVRSRTRKGTNPKFRNLEVRRDLNACIEYWCKQLGVSVEELDTYLKEAKGE